jgi:hypothetical protein
MDRLFLPTLPVTLGPDDLASIRSIGELEAPGFKHNYSTDIIRQRAAEKERSREAKSSAYN